MGASARFFLAFVSTAAAASACGDDGGSGDGPPMEGEVELGTGTTEFEPLADESELGLVAGPQGGHHFIVHVRMSGMVPGDPTMPGLIGNPSTRFTVTGED